MQTPKRPRPGRPPKVDKGKQRAEPRQAQVMERAPLMPSTFELPMTAFAPAEQAAMTNDWLRAVAPAPANAPFLQQPQPQATSSRLTVPESLAAPDPWGPYAATPEPAQPQSYLPPRPIPFHYQAPGHDVPLLPPPQSSFYSPGLPPLGVVPAGALPPSFQFCLPSDPVNQQHGPVVPNTVLRNLGAPNDVEDMNAKFPFMFSTRRDVGVHSPVFVSDNGHMHYYAWGDYRGVAMLTMTVPVFRMHELQLGADAEDMALQMATDRNAKRAATRPSRAKRKKA